MADRRVIVGGALFAVLLVALWLFPLVVFPKPGANDAIWLANLQLLLILLGAVGTIAAVVLSGSRRAEVCVELAVLLIGSGAAMLLGLAVFGNLTNDRFLPLVFLPPLIAGPGLFLLLIGLLLRGNRRDVLTAATYGAVGAVVVAVWILVRGARDWLLAPYGFDELAVMLVIGAGLMALRGSARG